MELLTLQEKILLNKEEAQALPVNTTPMIYKHHFRNSGCLEKLLFTLPRLIETVLSIAKATH